MPICSYKLLSSCSTTKNPVQWPVLRRALSRDSLRCSNWHPRQNLHQDPIPPTSIASHWAAHVMSEPVEGIGAGEVGGALQNLAPNSAAVATVISVDSPWLIGQASSVCFAHSFRFAASTSDVWLCLRPPKFGLVCLVLMITKETELLFPRPAEGRKSKQLVLRVCALSYGAPLYRTKRAKGEEAAASPASLSRPPWTVGAHVTAKSLTSQLIWCPRPSVSYMFTKSTLLP